MSAAALLLLTSVASAGGPDFDHQHTRFDTFLDGAVTDGGVRYDLLATRRDTLDAYLAEVAGAPVDSFSDSQKLALYLNAYNGYTLATLLDAMPVSSIREIDAGKVWTTRHFNVGGATLTLDDIEHKQVRVLGDGRIHAGVNCASKGCPPLRPDAFTATEVDAQLTAAATDWVRKGGAYRIEGDTVHLSAIFQWFGEDFGGDAPTWIAAYAVEADRERLASGTLTIAWSEYDWSLNRAE